MYSPNIVDYFATQHGFEVSYFNNERILTRVGATPPLLGSEICISNLPQNICEDHLYTHFIRYAKIYRIRLKLNRFYNGNVGTAYITFDTPLGAINATSVENVVIYPGYLINITLSDDNRRLYIAKIPRQKKKKQVWSELTRKGIQGVVDVIMYKSNSDRNKNRGYVFIDFITHQVAQTELQKLNLTLLFELRINASWAYPQQRSANEGSTSGSTLYLKNLTANHSSYFLRMVLQQILGEEKRIEKVYKKNDYAFVTFKTRHDAQNAMDLLKKYFKNIPSNIIIVNWALPRPLMRKIGVQKRPGSTLIE